MKRLAVIVAVAWVLWKARPIVAEIERRDREVDRMARLRKIFRPLDFAELYPGHPEHEVKILFEGDLRQMAQELVLVQGIGDIEAEMRVDVLRDGTRILLGSFLIEYPHFSLEAEDAILQLLQDHGFMYHVPSGKFVIGGVL